MVGISILLAFKGFGNNEYILHSKVSSLVLKLWIEIARVGVGSS